jgi:hypothetical protein
MGNITVKGLIKTVNTRSLAEKQNEALRLMPVLFYENGYDVTVCDPPCSLRRSAVVIPF